jgi:hypothetical protein
MGELPRWLAYQMERISRTSRFAKPDLSSPHSQIEFVDTGGASMEVVAEVRGVAVKKKFQVRVGVGGQGDDILVQSGPSLKEPFVTEDTNITDAVQTNLINQALGWVRRVSGK